RSTPQDAAKARLRRTGTDADLAAASTDCSADGLCDMLGSLLEWTSTRWPRAPRHPVVRGMSYRFAASDPQLEISIHHRQAIDPKTTDNELGFRCAATADKGP
ncbi:MAG: SUMF1/EgtB/PvdO family nonheme iron enzyme, partial [Deltaproteobacteria bacterium]|nr:SUMF1/EgtB/PvdO family nonheme iron enzyme [Deltaproteobacteria bacterium]